MACRCPKCGKIIDEEEWKKGKGPDEIVCDDPVGAFFGSILFGGLGAALGPIGAIGGAIFGALLFGKERKKRNSDD